MKAIQTKILGPTATRGPRIKAWAGGVAAKTYSGHDNQVVAAKDYAIHLGWISPDESLRSGTLPNGDMCHVLPARRSVPLDKAKLDRLLSAAHKVADIMDSCPDDETAAEAGLELERAAAAIGE